MPESVLIYSMGEVIGDGMIKLPFVAAVREAFPGARIVWCAAGGETVYAGPLKPVTAGLIDEILTAGPTGAKPLDGLFGGKPFGGRCFDLVIDTQENPRRSRFVKRAGGDFISATKDFCYSTRRPSADDKTRWPPAVVDRLAKLLSLAKGGPATLKPIKLADDRARAAAEALLPDGRHYVGFAPGAGGQDKRWPLASYLALAERARGAGLTPVFFFGPDEAEDARTTRAALPDALMPEFERTDAFQDVKGPLLVVAMAARLKAAVANDAGPGHMLAAGGAPLLSLQKDHRRAIKFRPAAERLKLLVAEDFGPTMAALPIETVWEGLTGLLEEGG